MLPHRGISSPEGRQSETKGVTLLLKILLALWHILRAPLRQYMPKGGPLRLAASPNICPPGPLRGKRERERHIKCFVAPKGPLWAIYCSCPEGATTPTKGNERQYIDGPFGAPLGIYCAFAPLGQRGTYMKGTFGGRAGGTSTTKGPCVYL